MPNLAQLIKPYLTNLTKLTSLNLSDPNISNLTLPNGAPTGARVPFVRVPSYPGEVTRVPSYPGKTNTRVEIYQGGKLPWGHLPGCQILFLHFFSL